MANLSVEQKSRRGYLQKHANKRARERIGLELNRHDMRAIINDIRDGKYGRGCIKDKPKWYKVTYECRKFWVLYRADINKIVTILDKVPRIILEKSKKH